MGALILGIDNWFLALAFKLQIHLQLRRQLEYGDRRRPNDRGDHPARESLIVLTHVKIHPISGSVGIMTPSRWHPVTICFFRVNLRFQASPLPLYWSLAGNYGDGWGSAWNRVAIRLGVLHGMLSCRVSHLEGRATKMRHEGTPSRSLAQSFCKWTCSNCRHCRLGSRLRAASRG